MNPSKTPRSPLRATPLLALLLVLASHDMLAAQSGRPPPQADRPRAAERASSSGAVLAGGRTHSRALLVALHGGSWKGRTADELAAQALADFDEPARDAGLRLLVPRAPPPSDDGDYQVPWLTHDGEALVVALLEGEVAAGRADRDRLYLAGHGVGATGAITLASRHPGLLAGVAGWSGTPEPLWDSDHRVVGLAENVVGGLGATPLYLWTGTDDRALDAATLQRFITDLRAARGDVGLLWEQSAGGHGLGPSGPRAGLKFLARQRLPRTPRLHGARPG